MVGKVPNLEPQSSGLRLPKGVRQYWSPFFQKWITKQTPTRQPLTSIFRKASTENFKTAQQLIRQVSAEDWQAATDMSRNTPFLTRDLLMKNAYGNLLVVRDEAGTEWMGVGVLNANIQQLLNSITTMDDTMLVRIEGYWVALIPGSGNQVLTIDPETGHPRWMPAQGGAGGAGEPYVLNLGPAGAGSGIGYDSIGQIIRAQLDTQIPAVSLDTNYTNGRVYKIGIAPYDRATEQMTSAPFYSNTWTASATGRQNHRFVIPDQPIFTAGQDFIVFMVLVSGTGTTGTTMQFSNQPYSAPGFYVDTDTMRAIASTNPLTTDTWARHGFTGVWGFQIEYLFPA